MRWKAPALGVGQEYARRLEQLRNTEVATDSARKSGSATDFATGAGAVGAGAGKTNAPSKTLSGDEDESPFPHHKHRNIGWSSNDIDFDCNILVEDKYKVINEYGDDVSSSSKSGASKAKAVVIDGRSADCCSEIKPVMVRGRPITAAERETLCDDLQAFGPGWRIEFRPLEVQLTDFENAAYAVFVVLLARALLQEGHNYYMPMSKVHENMRRAQLKDAVLTQKFWIRRNAFGNGKHRTDRRKQHDKAILQDGCELFDTASQANADMEVPDERDIDLVELSIDEIFNGENPNNSSYISSAETSGPPPKGCSTEKLFPGLIPQMYSYIESLGCSTGTDVFQQLSPYLTLLKRRAAGEIPTAARFIRDFVLTHPDYMKQQRQQQQQCRSNMTLSDTMQSAAIREVEQANWVTAASATATADGIRSPSVPLAGCQWGQLTQTLADDLLQLCEDIGMGRRQCPELYGAGVAIANLDRIPEEGLMFSNHTMSSSNAKTSINSSSSNISGTCT